MQEQSSENEGDGYDTDSMVSVYNITSEDLFHRVELARKSQKKYSEKKGDGNIVRCTVAQKTVPMLGHFVMFGL